LTINGDGGGNTYNVGSVGNTGSGTLAQIAGDFTINGGGATDTLNVDDGGNATASSYTVTDADVQRLGTGLISYNAIGGLNLTTGGGGSAIDVESTSAGVPVIVTVQDGNNDLEVAQVGQTLSELVSPLTFTGTTSTDSVTINDQSTTTAQTYTINPDNTLGGVFATASGVPTISLVNPVGNLLVYGGSGGDTFEDAASRDTTVWVIGGGSASANSLAGNSTPPIGGFTDDGQGTITGPAGYLPVYYFNVGNVSTSGF
jgi:hypothetical protein